MNSVGNPPLQTRIGFQQIPDVIFVNCFFAYLTPQDILKFGLACRRIQLLAVSTETIYTIGIHQFRLNPNNSIEPIITGFAHTLLKIKKNNSKKKNKKRENLQNKKLIYKLSAGFTPVNLSILWVDTLNSHRYERSPPDLFKVPYQLDITRLYRSFFPKARNKRPLPKDLLKSFLKIVLSNIANLHLEGNGDFIEHQAGFSFIYLKILFFGPLFPSCKEKFTLMSCLVQARERHKNVSNSPHEKYLSPITKAFDLCKVLEACSLSDPKISAAVTNDLLLPDSLDIGEKILKEFADKYPTHPFSGRIRRAFREKEMRGKLGLIADIWNHANRLIIKFLTPPVR